MSAFIFRFKADYLEKMHGYSHFSLSILTVLEDLLTCGPKLVQKVGTVVMADMHSDLAWIKLLKTRLIHCTTHHAFRNLRSSSTSCILS